MDFYRIFASSYRLTNIFSSKNIKKILLFVLIGVILFLVFSNNAFATDNEVSLSEIPNLEVNNQNVIVTSTNYHIYYFKTEPGFVYHLNNNSSTNWKVFYSEDNINLGDEVNYISAVNGNSSYDFVGTGGYFICWNGTNSNSVLTVTTDYSKDMSGVSADFVDTLSPDNLWAQFGFAIPLIGVAVLFALGFFVVRKVTKGESKAKVKF